MTSRAPTVRLLVVPLLAALMVPSFARAATSAKTAATKKKKPKTPAKSQDLKTPVETAPVTPSAGPEPAPNSVPTGAAPLESARPADPLPGEAPGAREPAPSTPPSESAPVRAAPPAPAPATPFVDRRTSPRLDEPPAPGTPTGNRPWLRAAGSGLVLVGLGSAAAAGVVGWQALDAQARVQGSARNAAGVVVGLTQKDAAALDVRARGLAVVSTGLLVAGAVATVGGAALTVMGDPGEGLAIVPAPNGVLLSLNF